MGKNTKKGASAAQAAAEQQKAPNAQNTQTKRNEVAVISLGEVEKLVNTKALAGMDPNHTEDLIHLLDKRFYDDKEAAKRYNIPQESVDKINEITAIGMVALLVNETTLAQTPFAIAMRRTQLENIREAASQLNVVIDMKALPAPNADGMIEVPSTAIKPSEEAKEAVKEEIAAANSKAETVDPTKIENEEQLKASLLKLLVNNNKTSNFYQKVVNTVAFYQAYLKIQANKSENKTEELAKINEMTTANFLTDISHILGRCPFTTSGMAKFMYENTERSKSPIIAFCTLRDASLNKTTGMPQIDDQVVADIVKVLVRWYGDSLITESNARIKGFEEDIKTLKDSDAKKNAKGIEDGKKAIANAKEYINHVEEVVGYCNVPEKEFVDSFKENYNDSSKEGYKMARMVASKIMKTYYPGVSVKEVEPENLAHNLQQYVGVISNMFLPALNQMVEYSEANITELEKVEPKNE